VSTIIDAPLEKLKRLAELQRQASARVAERYYDDPVGWAEVRLGEFLWSKQCDVARSVVEHRRTAVKSAHDTGKSFTASRLTAWWLDVHEPGTAFVVTTAPTAAQVRAILWREIGRAHRKGNLPGRCLQTEWQMGDELVAYGRKPADYDEEAFQGIHAEFVLVIIDEACGVPHQLWIAANSLAANENARILAIGNPDDPTSHFAKVCQPGSGWNVIHIAAKHSPNFTDEKVPDDLRPLLISQTYLDEMAADVGEGSPIWTSKVEGEFPSDTTHGVVLASQLAACRRPSDNVETEPVELGVDVAGSEDGDVTVIRERRGWKAGRSWRLQSPESEVIAAEVRTRIVETGAVKVKIDAIGIGWGVAGHLNDMAARGEHTAEIVKVNVGEASSNPKRYPKLRDQIWWEIGRLHTEQGTWDLSEIDDRTAADLLAPQWSPDAAGRIKVEPKDETRKRLGRSPDDGDALLLAFYAGRKGGRMRYRR
jgi:hypothetical protein